MWSNFHTHSNYCDGKASVGDIVAAAKSTGAAMIGISSHAPLPFECVWSMKPVRLDEYLDEIDSLKNTTGFPLYKGLEVDYIPGIVSPADFAHRLDYTIGSIHFVDQLAGGRRWEIDGTNSFFTEGLSAIFSNDIRAAVERYFELTRQMIETGTPDIVGHLDKIKMQNTYSPLFDENDSWYRKAVERTLNIIRETGVIVEVNTRGLYQRKTSTTYPSPWVLEKMYELKIPITLNSDAHHPDDLFNSFSETAQLLNRIGYRRLSVLFEGDWQLVPFGPNGIVLEKS